MERRRQFPKLWPTRPQLCSFDHEHRQLRAVAREKAKHLRSQRVGVPAVPARSPLGAQGASGERHLDACPGTPKWRKPEAAEEGPEAALRALAVAVGSCPPLSAAARGGRLSL